MVLGNDQKGEVVHPGPPGDELVVGDHLVLVTSGVGDEDALPLVESDGQDVMRLLVRTPAQVQKQDQRLILRDAEAKVIRSRGIRGGPEAPAFGKGPEVGDEDTPESGKKRFLGDFFPAHLRPPIVQDHGQGRGAAAALFLRDERDARDVMTAGLQVRPEVPETGGGGAGQGKQAYEERAPELALKGPLNG